MDRTLINESAKTTLEKELDEVYSQRPISDPSRFSGRVEQLSHCRTQLAVRGMSFAIYGERGLGKSSFVNVLLDGRRVLKRTAEEEMPFAQLLGEVLTALGENMVITETNTREGSNTTATLKTPVAEVGAGASAEIGQTFSAIQPAGVDLDRVAAALGRHSADLDFVVIEEFHRLGPGSQRSLVQLMKAISDRDVGVRLVVTGTRDWGDQLMTDAEYKAYIGRNITPVRLPAMTMAELGDIIAKRAKLGITVDANVAKRLTWVASGYPALVHRVMFDAGARWIAQNVVAVAGSLIGAVTSALLGSLGGAGVAMASSLVQRKADLKKADVSVGKSDLDSALERYARTYESESQSAGGYAALAVDDHLRRILDAYAFDGAVEFNLGSVAKSAGLSVGDAREICALAPAWFTSHETPRPAAGLRPYLRAMAVLGEDPRVEALVEGATHPCE